MKDLKGFKLYTAPAVRREIEQMCLDVLIENSIVHPQMDKTSADPHFSELVLTKKDEYLLDKFTMYCIYNFTKVNVKGETFNSIQELCDHVSWQDLTKIKRRAILKH